MLIAVMSVLQERLPCSEYVFREKREFKEEAIKKKLGDGKDVIKAEKECLSPYRAIASPKLISGYSPQTRSSSGSLIGLFNPEQEEEMKVGENSDFKIKNGGGI
jgi:hypothetical protein